MMGYTTAGARLWPWPPDWSQSVNETLAWRTDVLQAAAGMQQARALRDAPRRGFSFQAIAAGDTRRIVDALRFDLGVSRFLLPIYPDVQWLPDALASGVTTIPCRTAGFDFVAGGQAVLWRDANEWELVTIDSIAADHIVTTAATGNAWAIGTRLYPVRHARLDGAPSAKAANDDVTALQVQVAIDEPCDWPAAWPTTTTYRGQPVLEWRNEESEQPTDQYDRAAQTVDFDVGPVYHFDLPGMPFRAQSQRFQLLGRADHTKFRSLAYRLAGRAGQLWVPSWLADVRLAQSVTSSATQVTVPWMGYAQFGYLQANRRDLVIELQDGTRLYRRITGSAESGATEVLQLDSALGRALAPGDVRQIGWLSLCAAAADSVAIQHVTDADGAAVSKLGWQALKNDV